jgi:hypothetical protein
MLTRLTGWEGEAEVLGRLRAVRYDPDARGGVLRIAGLTMQEATEVLRKAAVGRIATTSIEADHVVVALHETTLAEHPAAPPGSAVVPVCDVPAEEYAAQEKEILAGGSPPPAQAVPKAAAGNGGAGARADAPPPSAPDHDASGAPAAASAPLRVSDPFADAAAPQVLPNVPPEPSSDPPADAEEDALVHALRQAKFLRDILSLLIGSGVQRDSAALVEACRARAAKVPLLQRITDLDTRVQRTLLQMKG